MDADRQRDEIHRRWDRVAGGWFARRDEVRRIGAEVSHRLVEAIAPQPGQTVLEIGAGIGDTGMLAAELVRPAGKLICSDASEAMLENARKRARELEIDNVEFRELNAEWLDVPTASVDAVLSRWTLMLLVDPAAAARECRRVLVPGGRLAVAVWDSAEHNPWATRATPILIERGLMQAPEPGAPDLFALAPAQRIEGLLLDAGFQDVRVEAVDLTRRYDDVDQWWSETVDLSGPFKDAIEGLDDDEIETLRAAVDERMSPFRVQHGPITLPGRSLVASASA